MHKFLNGILTLKNIQRSLQCQFNLNVQGKLFTDLLKATVQICENFYIQYPIYNLSSDNNEMINE